MAQPLDVIPSESEIPEHASFGIRRRHDIHSGIDLYAPEGANVYAIRAGIVLRVAQFTGVNVGSPWWNDTDYVGIGDHHETYIVYGEVTPLVKEGEEVTEGQLIGRVKQVLRNDKGRPMSMLHLEHYASYIDDPVVWKLDEEMHPFLIDPTPLVFKTRLNVDATSLEEAFDYLTVRGQQMKHVGVVPLTSSVMCGTAYMTFLWKEVTYVSVYVLRQDRGKGLYKRVINALGLPVITIRNCGIEAYLSSHKIPHVVVKGTFDTPEYKAVQRFYGNRTAKRSGQFYMKHIDEGLALLNKQHVDDAVMRAWCLHPLFQKDTDLVFNFGRRDSLEIFDASAVVLAMEYRSVANEYLSYRTIKNVDEIRLSPLKAVNQMLYADKIQNYADLVQFNKEHPRFRELVQYFNNWFERLEGNV